MSDPRGRPRRKRWMMIAIVFVITGCAAGPDFTRPEPPPVKGYTDSIARLTAMDTLGQHLAVGRGVSARWWQLFHSPQLNVIVTHAIGGNQTLAAAQATLAQAHEAVNQARGGYYPQVDLSASVERQRFGTSTSPAISTSSTRTIYSVGPTVSYAVDAFGGTRRKVEQQAALAENAHDQLAAAYLTLTGNTVGQAINIASSRQQLIAIEEIVAGDQKTVDLVKLKFDAGRAARSDVLTAESQLAADQTLAPPVRQQLNQARHALSVLAGRFPAQWSPPDFDLERLVLPDSLPVTIPSELVRQRPDILAAESNLHAASAAIGVAQAQLYPSISLSGSLATAATSGNALFGGSSFIWSLFGGLTAPIFHGGALRAQKRGAVDAYEASFATYRQTVLSAFQQVADVLHALDEDTNLLEAEQRSVSTSRASLELQRLSYTAGKSTILQLVDAERTYQQARLGYVRALAQRYQDTVQLFVAMGGGWWQAPELGASSR